MTQKQKEQGKGILYMMLLLTVLRFYLAWLIGRQFNITFWRAYRYVAIGGYAAFFLGREWQSGVISYTRFREDVEDWTENFKAWAEKEKARKDAQQSPAAATQRHAA